MSLLKNGADAKEELKVAYKTDRKAAQLDKKAVKADIQK